MNRNIHVTVQQINAPKIYNTGKGLEQREVNIFIDIVRILSAVILQSARLNYQKLCDTNNNNK